MKKLLCLVSLTVLSQAHAAGYFRSGTDLEELEVVLASMGHVGKALFAKGYVSGVADATSGQSWCPISRTTEDQLYRSIADFITAHPKTMNRSAATIVVDALAAEFPCDKK